MRNETTYDCANRMIQKTLPADGVYKYTYDIRSALTKIKEPEGGKTTYTEASRTSPRRHLTGSCGGPSEEASQEVRQ
ncbi:hypothetical protein AALA13_17990 [Lachnospiraceae bacterium 50-23]